MPTCQSKPVSKQSKTSHEATSQEQDLSNGVVVYSTNSSPTPINYPPPNVLTKDRVQKIIGQEWTRVVATPVVHPPPTFQQPPTIVQPPPTVQQSPIIEKPPSISIPAAFANPTPQSSPPLEHPPPLE
ncbi:hypothetical protein JHK82_048285 [Glycine max]|nr:hypothetical protein JHK82_048285 [Glycine max]